TRKAPVPADAPGALGGAREGALRPATAGAIVAPIRTAAIARTAGTDVRPLGEHLRNGFPPMPPIGGHPTRRGPARQEGTGGGRARLGLIRCRPGPARRPWNTYPGRARPRRVPGTTAPRFGSAPPARSWGGGEPPSR